MRATQILMDEHRVIERVLSVLEVAVSRLEAGESIDATLFIDATEFIREFADGCHHRKEEGVLFLAMNAAGMPSDEGPIGVMLAEHKQARAYTRGLLEAAEKVQAGDANAVEQVIGNARGYAVLLRQHIAKEDNVLFPMAATVIPASEHDRLLSDYERVEGAEMEVGVHDKYVALADRLERQVEG
jgi:hemerythrin-like domain-containing protein